MSFNTDVGAFGIGSTIGGGITQAFGAFLGGEAQKAYYDYQAGIARMNAIIAEQNAHYAINVGEIQAQQSGLEGGQRMGRIVAGQSASGLDVGSGSAKQVQASEVGLERTAQTSIRSTAAKQAYNYRVEAAGFTAQAQADIMAGKNAMTAGMIGAVSSIVGTATSVSSMWLKGQSVGLFNVTGWGGGGGTSANNPGGIGMM